MLKRITILLILSTVNILTAQNNINTPYSLFGLGVENNTATGGLTGLGNSGIAQKTYNQINIYNPSNLANLPKETFLQDYGISGGGSTLKNYNTSESRINANVSHVLFAFRIKKGLGVSFGVLPYTTTGYKIDLVSNIEGSSGKYVTRLIGTGGINNFYISSGIKITKNLSVGVGFSALFGSVNQNSQLYLNSLVDIKDKNHYTGVKLNTGLQYTLFSNDKNQTTLGSVVEFPTFLGGTQTRTSSKILSNGASIALEKGVKKSLKDYELPLSVGVGLSSSFEKFTVNVDYKKKFWENTNQSINSGRYTNQSIYAFGLYNVHY